MSKVKQEYTSKNTCRNHVPALIKYLTNKNIWYDGQVILDFGGGKYDRARKYVESLGWWVRYYIYDEYNRTVWYNTDSLRHIHHYGKCDIIIIANTLNVIKEQIIRLDTLRFCKKLLKKTGKIYISIYNAKKTNKYIAGSGQETRDGWQVCEPLTFYKKESTQIFKNVVKKYNFLELWDD